MAYRKCADLVGARVAGGEQACPKMVNTLEQKENTFFLNRSSSRVGSLGNLITNNQVELF